MVVPIDLLSLCSTICANSAASTSRRGPGSGLFDRDRRSRRCGRRLRERPAARAELKAGDVILAVNGEKNLSQTGFYRKLWDSARGVDVPLTVYHGASPLTSCLASTDRAAAAQGATDALGVIKRRGVPVRVRRCGTDRALKTFQLPGNDSHERGRVDDIVAVLRHCCNR